MKQCKKCLKEKPINDFYLSRGKPLNTCKECDKKRISNNYHKNPFEKKNYAKKRYSLKKDEINLKKRELTKDKNSNIKCLECLGKFNRVKSNMLFCCRKCWYKYNRRQNLENKQQYARERYSIRKKDLDFMIKKREIQKKNYLTNKKKIIYKNVKYNLKRYHSDPIFNIICKLRRRINKTLKSKNISKNHNWNTAYGCTPSFLKSYLESLFSEGMTWDKILTGEIHIDHIKPISLATTEDEVYELNHYSNLQPLWADDNLKKSNNF